MNIHKLKMDTSGNVEDISFVLAYRNGDKISNIENVNNIVAKHCMNEASEFTCTVHKKIGDNIVKCWDDIKDFKLIWIPEWDMWYQITVEINDEDDNIKNVSGTTLGEAELSQIMLYGIEINTETDIARDDYEIPTIFYNTDHPEASLLNRILDEKAPHYTIKHVDASLKNLQRTFTFDDTSIYDALQDIAEELDCLFVFGCGSDKNGKPERTISVYDLEANCLDCGYRDTFENKCPKCNSTNIKLGYGEYTNVFISKENLAEEITYSVDTDAVKNCFKLEAGDDLMTAAIRSCNPNGTDYIYYFPDETRSEMSQELQDKLKTYDVLYEEYQSSHVFTLEDSFVINYNAIVNKYKKYEENLTEIKNPIVGYPKLMQIYFDTIDMVQFLRNKLMPPVDKPDNNAQSQGEYLMENLPSSASTTSLKSLSVSTADNIMIMLAQSIVKGSFKITVSDSTLSNNVWRGKFNLKNYSDDDDTFTSQFVSISINENYESYVKQRIETILNKADADYYDIVGLFKQDMDVFKSQLKKYCLNSLQIFQKCCQSCIDMMMQQGISSNDSSSVYGINTSVLYENVYVPYYNKMNAIQDEIKVREDEVYTIEGKYNNQNELVMDGIQTEIERIITEVQDTLNFKNYIGNDLYKEFSSFIRMDKYSNENYVSDGLNNTELMQNAIEFISVATKELFKSATLQHSITGTIKNFLRMKEFEPVANNFKNGNWICVGIDDKVYRLRIIEYDIDFSDTQNIDVTFSDVLSLPDGMSDLESILSNSSKMATSYSGVVRQSAINTNFKNKMNEMIAKGLDMTNTKIVSNADNQDITWDEHGLLCREYNDVIDDYTDEQLKIINHGIYITDDNWKTARSAIGKFWYFDPKDKTYKQSYGVIADTLVSNLILTSEVGIYNEEKSIEMAENGIVVTTNTMNKNVFTIRKEITDDEGNVTYERQLYIDDNGNIVLGGNASISWDNITGTDNVVVKDTLNEFLKTIQTQLDGKIETFRQENDPSVNWTDEEKELHKNDLWYNTSTKEVKIYNGSSWDNFTGDVPDEVWDKIDGKAQIFIATPKPPYDTGDLWFTDTQELYTCIKQRKEGEEFNSEDWEKKVKYTDDTTANNVKKDLESLAGVLGYDGTKITGTYIYSPNILGGAIAIGDKDGIHASITTDGKLTATGVDITGTINATDGVFTNVDIQSGKIGGLTLANNSISSSNNNFSVTSNGKLTANDATIKGNITATSGSFTGAITATSLTLGTGVTIGASKVSGLSNVATSGSYDDLSDKPDIPNMTLYIKKDGTIGTIADGSTGFKVSTNGLLQASNAIIYGTIFASAGIIGGFNIATTLDNSSHAYSNTLYTQTTDSSGNTYQAGIKGNSIGNADTEAAFYIRKKENGTSSWDNSTVPFYVRKNGQVYCSDITLGQTVNMINRSDTSKKDLILGMNDDNGNSRLGVGLLNTGSKTLYYQSQIQFCNMSYKSAFIINTPTSGTTSIIPGSGYNTYDIGSSSNPITNLYVTNINGKAYTGGSGPSKSYTAGEHINISTDGVISANVNHTDTSGTNIDGLATRYWVYHHYSLDGHTHSGYVSTSGNSTSSPISGTLYMANNCGWNVLNTSGSSVTGIYCTKNNGTYTDDYDTSGKGNLMVISDHNYTTVLRGSTIMIGNKTNSQVRMPSLAENSSATKYLVKDDNGYIGWKTGNSNTSSLSGGLTINLNGSTSDVNSWKGTSNVSVNITPSSIGAATSSHTHSQYLTSHNDWGLSISGTTLKLVSNGGSKSITLPTSSSGTTYTAGDYITISSGKISAQVISDKSKIEGLATRYWVDKYFARK